MSCPFQATIIIPGNNYVVSDWLKCFSQPSSKLPQSLVKGDPAKPKVKKNKYGVIVTQATSKSSITPLVVILGWNDCKTKHLQKYSGLFESRGWSTVCLPAKSYNTFLRADTKVKTISFYIIDLIKDLAKKGNPVILYSFSNGGCAVYFHIAEALTTPGQQHFNAFTVVGSIFDSCPSYPTFEGIPRAQQSATEGMNPVIKSLIQCVFEVAMRYVLKKPIIKRFAQDIGKMPVQSPELFLYSSGDKLCLAQDVEQHIGNRKLQGAEVFSKCWEDSSHVAHYMKYPEQYTEMVDMFLLQIL